MADFQTELEQFRVGLRRLESGGNYKVRNKIGAGGAYQYMPGTWRSWAGPALARMYPEAQMAPPEIQDEVARRNMTALFHQFGSWFKVAKAWLGGPGNVDKNYSDGNVTQNEYANRVLSYAGLAANQLAATGVTVPGGEQLSTATPDQLATFTSGGDRHDLGTQMQSLLDMLDSVGPDQQAPAAAENPADEVQRRMSDAVTS